MKKLVLAAVVMLFSITTTAEPTGSLRTMLDTKITLIEYLQLQVRIDSLEWVVNDLKSQWVTEFGLYKSVVERNLRFDYDADRLVYFLNPIDEPIFKSMKEAKAYCRALIQSQRSHLVAISDTWSRPGSWGNSRTNADDFVPGLLEKSILQTYIPQRKIEGGEEFLKCKANLNGEGDIKSWSFNI